MLCIASAMPHWAMGHVIHPESYNFGCVAIIGDLTDWNVDDQRSGWIAQTGRKAATTKVQLC
jgi:hypothetical protein